MAEPSVPRTRVLVETLLSEGVAFMMRQLRTAQAVPDITTEHEKDLMLRAERALEELHFGIVYTHRSDQRDEWAGTIEKERGYGR